MRRLLSILTFLLVCSTLLAQNVRVSGSVRSADDGSPLAGVFLSVPGYSGVNTISDSNGNFSFSVPSDAVTLVASLLGMEDLEERISPVMNLVMKPERELLDEVMVVAYGTARKSSYSGSASIVHADEIGGLPVTSFENALAGRVSGLQVTSSSGQAGSAPSIRIRGNGSMNASNEPLYVIDGVPVMNGSVGQMDSWIYASNNVMNSINPDDIESISVLKDAAASSLYGSRAANGVIVITTKKGTQGRPKVSLNASIGLTPEWATGNYETVSVQDNVNMLYSIFYDYAKEGQGRSDADAVAAAITRLNGKFRQHGYEFSAPGLGKYQNIDILGYDNSGREGKYFDWDDAYYRTAVYQNYDLSVGGATDKTNYYSSLSYTNDQGRLRMNEFDRVSGRLNLNQKVNSWMEFGTNVSLSRTSKSGYNDTRNTNNNFFMQTRNLLWGLYWPTNYKDGSDWTERYGSYARNGLYTDKQWENSSVNLRLSAVETLTLHLAEGLDLKSIFSYDNTNVKDHLYYSALHPNGSATNGSVTEMRTVYNKIVSSTTANWNRTFGSHTIGVMAGFEAEKNKTDYTRSSGENLPTSTLHTVTTAGTTTAAGYDWGYSMVSILSKVDYNWAERYYASASYRRDGSSRLSPDTRWGDFWSVAASWRIAKEEWLSDAGWLSELKLRASYGVNGTLPSSNYGYMNLISYTSRYNGNPGGMITTIANNDLSWETSYTWNIGLDFGLWDGRLTGTVEYFNRDSKDLLQDVPISTVTGFSSTLQNIGEINNRGFEVELAGDIIRNRSLVWSAHANAAFVHSSVEKLYGGQDIIWDDPTGSDSRAQFIYREGESTLAFYGYEWAGVDPANGKSVYYVNDPSSDSAGDFQFNGRGATYDFNKANEVIIGNAVPKISGGFGTDLRWNGFDLSLNFNYKLGGKLYDGAEKDVADDGYYWERIRSKYYFKHMWTPDRPNGSQPALSGLDLEDAMQYSSRHIYNASFLRLKSMTLGYTIPALVTSKVGISSARVYFTGSNLLTFAKYPIADPEVNEYGTRGWETPFGKTYTFGINLTF